MNRICIDEKKYNNLITLINKKKQEPTPYRNIKFELDLILLSLTDFAQYDENSKQVILAMTEQNKNRLIGFLLEQLFSEKNY